MYTTPAVARTSESQWPGPATDTAARPSHHCTSLTFPLKKITFMSL
jgi:hypothetical protein